METVVVVIHLMVIVAMVALVLLQRSEGGALGIGGGGGGGFMSSRGQGNVLTRSTAILAAAFFATSIILTIIARMNEPASSILDDVPAVEAPASTPGSPGTARAFSMSSRGCLNRTRALRIRPRPRTALRFRPPHSCRRLPPSLRFRPRNNR